MLAAIAPQFNDIMNDSISADTANWAQNTGDDLSTLLTSLVGSDLFDMNLIPQDNEVVGNDTTVNAFLKSCPEQNDAHVLADPATPPTVDFSAFTLDEADDSSLYGPSSPESVGSSPSYLHPISFESQFESFDNFDAMILPTIKSDGFLQLSDPTLTMTDNNNTTSPQQQPIQKQVWKHEEPKKPRATPSYLSFQQQQQQQQQRKEGAAKQMASVSPPRSPSGQDKQKTRRHACKFCPKAFVTPSKLRRHERIHTGDKPYHCNHCKQRFTQRCGLKVHSNLHARELMTKSNEPKEVLMNQKINGFLVSELAQAMHRAGARREAKTN